MAQTSGKRPASRYFTTALDARAGCDSQAFVPPLELVALVGAGVLAGATPVLDLGCGRATEAVFLATMGWTEVFALDADEDAVTQARAHARQRAPGVKVEQADLLALPEALPKGWPRAFGLVLDRFCINNMIAGFEDHPAEAARDIYFNRVSSIVKPGGILVLRDRWDADLPDASYRRSLFEPLDPARVLGAGGGPRLFEPLPGGHCISTRFIGDDTHDPHRFDAMLPIRGMFAVLRRRGGRRRARPK